VLKMSSCYIYWIGSIHTLKSMTWTKNILVIVTEKWRPRCKAYIFLIEEMDIPHTHTQLGWKTRIQETMRQILIYLLTAVGLSPGGSTHLHKNNT
jgi:hypothetical protein